MADNDINRNDGIQHGIDDDPNNDASKGAKLGGVGGAVTGLIAGAAAGPAGAVIGAVVGGVAGAVGSGVAVAAVDRVDNDNNISGVGSGVNYDDDYYRNDYSSRYGSSGKTYEHYQPAYRYGADMSRDQRYSSGSFDQHESNFRNDYQSRNPGGNYDEHRDAIRSGYERGRTQPYSETGTRAEGLVGGNQVPGIQTGGRTTDGAPDTRGITEKAADALTGDRTDDKTGRMI